MIEIIYTGNQPIIINDIEFRYKKILKINQKQLDILKTNPYFASKIGSLFKVIGEPKIAPKKDNDKIKDNKEQEEVKQSPKEEVKKEVIEQIQEKDIINIEEVDELPENADGDQVKVVDGVEIIPDQTENEIEEEQEEVKPATNRGKNKNANTKQKDKS